MRARRIVASVALAIVFALLAVLPALAAPNFGYEVPGTSVYDLAGVLSPTERSGLEAQAASLRRDGVPAIIYIRTADRSSNQTMDEAKSLMAEWNIESTTGAKDGFVIFINLKPNDLKHGSAAIYAGKSLHDRSLPQYELDRIYGNQMLPLLKKADYSGAIEAALTTVQRDVEFGPPAPPPPSAFQRFSADATRGPLSPVNIIGLLVAVVGALFGLRLRAPAVRPAEAPTARTTPPGSLPPAMAGALVAGHASDDGLMQATLFDFAARGALAIEPVSDEKVQIHLLGDLRTATDWETALWSSLRDEANDLGIIEHDQIAKLQSHWGAPKARLRDALIDRGWFDRSVPPRRNAIYAIAGLLFLLGAGALILAMSGDQPLGAVGAGILAVTGISMFIVASRMRENSTAGEIEALPWRGLQRGLEIFGKEWDDPLDLDTVMPYAVALGVAKSLEKRFEAASDEGYAPIWLGPMQFRGNPNISSYVCWTVMNSAIVPAASGGSFSGAGAAAGGAGSGGSF